MYIHGERKPIMQLCSSETRLTTQRLLSLSLSACCATRNARTSARSSPLDSGEALLLSACLAIVRSLARSLKTRVNRQEPIVQGEISPYSSIMKRHHFHRRRCQPRSSVLGLFESPNSAGLATWGAMHHAMAKRSHLLEPSLSRCGGVLGPDLWGKGPVFHSLRGAASSQLQLRLSGASCLVPLTQIVSISGRKGGDCAIGLSINFQPLSFFLLAAAKREEKKKRQSERNQSITNPASAIPL